MSKRKGLPPSSRMRHDSHFVEQLVRADELPIGRKIAIHLLEANPDQPRSILGDLDDLKASIAEKGVLEPILVRPREGGRFTIIAGERRFRAALEAGLGEIPCIELNVSDAEMTELALVENLQRRDLSPLEEADGYATLQERYDYTHETIAHVIGKSRVTVTETLSLARLPLRVKDECRRADIRSKSFLLELSRLGTEEEMLAALAAHLGGESLSRDALRRAKREGPAAGGDADFQRFRKAYELSFQPDDRRYQVSLVLKGTLREKEEILGAIKDLLKKIEDGSVDLATAGRFLAPRQPKKDGAEASSPVAEPVAQAPERNGSSGADAPVPADGAPDPRQDAGEDEDPA